MSVPPEPRVIATGDTLTLLHHVYRIDYPNGTSEEVIPAQCKRDAEGEMEWVMRRARVEWKRRQQARRGVQINR